jgi:hypothetical protein
MEMKCYKPCERELSHKKIMKILKLRLWVGEDVIVLIIFDLSYFL